MAYGLEDPAANAAVGKFRNLELQAIYDSLIVRGNVSAVEALKVGCFIEEKDIQDIRDNMLDTDEHNISQVYQNLLCGSYEHLKAFNKVLVSRGGSYRTEIIDQSLWDAIVSGANQCTD